MKRDLFERATDVSLAALLIWFVTSLQISVATAPNSPNRHVSPLLYLNYYNTFRNAGLVRATTLSNFRVSQQTAKVDEMLFRMDSDLWRRRTLADQDYFRSKLRRDLSAAREHQLAQRSAILDATRKLNFIQADIMSGVSHDLRKLYDAYVEQWKGECALFKSNIEAALAQRAWDRYVLDLDTRLGAGSYISRADYLEHKRNVYAAEDDLATQRYLDSICLEKIPSYDDVRRLSSSD